MSDEQPKIVGDEPTREVDLAKIDFRSGETFKLFVRNKKNRPMSAQQIHELFTIIANNKVIYVPDNIEFVVVRSNGKVEVY